MSTVEDIFIILNRAPRGLTTAEVVAQAPGRTPVSISSKLSQLADYGRITRTFERTGSGGRRARWSLR